MSFVTQYRASCPRRWGLHILAGLMLVLVGTQGWAHPGHHAAVRASSAHQLPPEAVATAEVSGLRGTPTAVLAALREFRATGAGAALAAAEAGVADLLAGPSVSTEARYLAARVAQAAHRFDAALVHLDEVFAVHSGHAPAHALAAAIHTVQGRWASARAHCVAGRGDALQQVGCALRVDIAAGKALQESDYQRFAGLLDRLAASSAPPPAALGAWLEGIAGDLARHIGRSDWALARYRRARQLDPHTRILAAEADLLLADAQASAVLQLLPAETLGLGLRVKRLRAARQLGRLDAHSEELDRLSKEINYLIDNNDLGHAREVAEYLLALADQPRLAVRILRRGFALQREPEDERLLARALHASGCTESHVTEQRPKRVITRDPATLCGV